MNEAVEKYFAEEFEAARQEGRAEERQAAEEKDRHRVWRMREKGFPLTEIADNLDLSLDTVKNWINSPKPATV